MMAFIGVRMSWDILERKRLFAWLAASAARRASSRSSLAARSASLSRSSASRRWSAVGTALMLSMFSIDKLQLCSLSPAPLEGEKTSIIV